MGDIQFVLSREQRDEISRAAAAIGRRVKEMIARPDPQADMFVIWTNLTIIQTNLTNLPRVSPNL
jgi:hypothetical protein